MLVLCFRKCQMKFASSFLLRCWSFYADFGGIRASNFLCICTISIIVRNYSYGLGPLLNLKVACRVWKIITWFNVMFFSFSCNLHIVLELVFELWIRENKEWPLLKAKKYVSKKIVESIKRELERCEAEKKTLEKRRLRARNHWPEHRMSLPRYLKLSQMLNLKWDTLIIALRWMVCFSFIISSTNL